MAPAHPHVTWIAVRSVLLNLALYAMKIFDANFFLNCVDIVRLRARLGPCRFADTISFFFQRGKCLHRHTTYRDIIYHTIPLHNRQQLRTLEMQGTSLCLDPGTKTRQFNS